MQKGAWKEAGREDEDEVQFYSASGYMSHFVGLELLYSFRVSNHKFPHQSLGSCGIILSQHSPPPSGLIAAIILEGASLWPAGA